MNKPRYGSAPEPLSPQDEQLRATIVEALERQGGNITRAANDLGTHRQQLYRWIRRLGMDLGRFRR
jgi:transposase-like protein